MLKLNQEFVMADGRTITYKMVERLGMMIYQILIDGYEVATAMHELTVFNITQKLMRKAKSPIHINQKEKEPEQVRVLNYVWLNKDEIEFSIEN